jgi:predicted transcriptional regulator
LADFPGALSYKRDADSPNCASVEWFDEPPFAWFVQAVLDSAPPSLAQFLSERVTTYEELEVLLFLVAEGKPMTASELSARVGVHEAAARTAAQALAARGLLDALDSESVPRYAYSPENPCAEDVDLLVRMYRTERMTIVELMARNALSRIRAAALHTFAEAFRIHRKNDDR